MRRGLVFTAVALGLCALGLAFSGQSLLSQAEADYIGTEACLDCHEDEIKAFAADNPHHRAELDPELFPGRVGCESCHGPASLHAKADGDKDDPGYATVRIFKGLDAALASESCLECHEAGEQFYWDHSAHAQNEVACTTCHSVHKPGNPGETSLLTTEGVNELCMSCHKEQRMSQGSSGHMPVAEGGMDCASCHNPHGSSAPHNIRAESNTELCASCHADKRGPFLWEHAPVREDCVICHEPHGSNSDKLLAAKRPYLCQTCHAGTRHPSNLYDESDLASNRLFNRSCINCHTQIHGSNHPAGNTFLR